MSAFVATPEQARIIGHQGSAFIAACPGSGKTRIIVERARRLLTERRDHRGIAFLSFTNAAVSELEERLRREGLVNTPVFPHFLGTFDAFLWQFLIAPFGIDESVHRPRLIPDKDGISIQPFRDAHSLPLACFDRTDGTFIREMAVRHGFRAQAAAAHEGAARQIRARLLERGELDFADARTIALVRLRDPARARVLGPAFAARFQELIVDEAQDCDPADLNIIAWFREAGVPAKVICDPNQAIYGFRGGVTRELDQFRGTFAPCERLPLNGNFRSSQHIARAIVSLRAPHKRDVVDDALGVYRDEATPVHILSYDGQSVPASVGRKFRELTDAAGLDARDCPVVSATRLASANALGHPKDVETKDLTYRLAAAVSAYHYSFELGGRKEALVAIHKVILDLEGRIGQKTYHQHIADAELEPGAWRPRVIAIAVELRYDPGRFATAEAWHDHARQLLAPLLPAGAAQSINQRLRRNVDLPNALIGAASSGHPARTIHSVKGMQFPAVCVVLSPKTTKGIVDFLSAAGGDHNDEEARKIYVGASRAQRLLAIAVPRSQARRLRDLVTAVGADVEVTILQ